MIEIIPEESKRTIKVVRGGKVVTKKVGITKRPKRRSMKQRMALKKARRKANTGMAKRKRKRSTMRRSRIPSSQRKRATKYASKRRQLSRREDFNYDAINIDTLDFGGNFEDNFFLAEDDFEIVAINEEVYEILENYLINVDESEEVDRYILNVFDNNGDVYLEDIEVSSDTLINLFSYGLLVGFYVDDDDDDNDE